MFFLTLDAILLVWFPVHGGPPAAWWQVLYQGNQHSGCAAQLWTWTNNTHGRKNIRNPGLLCPLFWPLSWYWHNNFTSCGVHILRSKAVLVICSLIWQEFEREICSAKAFRFCTTMGESSSTRSYSDMTAALNQSQRFRKAMNWIASCFMNQVLFLQFRVSDLFCYRRYFVAIAQLDWTSSVQNSSTL